MRRVRRSVILCRARCSCAARGLAWGIIPGLSRSAASRCEKRRSFLMIYDPDVHDDPLAAFRGMLFSAPLGAICWAGILWWLIC